MKYQVAWDQFPAQMFIAFGSFCFSCSQLRSHLHESLKWPFLANSKSWVRAEKAWYYWSFCSNFTWRLFLMRGGWWKTSPSFLNTVVYSGHSASAACCMLLFPLVVSHVVVSFAFVEKPLILVSVKMASIYKRARIGDTESGIIDIWNKNNHAATWTYLLFNQIPWLYPRNTSGLKK